MPGPFPYYTKGLDDERPSVAASEIETLSMAGIDDPDGYLPSPDLAKAVNASLILGRPLLVTGEPGTGKTQLAYSIAHEIGRASGGNNAPARIVPVHKFETKSTSVARDLFYFYDAIAAFRAAPDERRPAIEYVTYQALGRAIIEAYDKSKIAHLLPPGDRYVHPGQARRSVVLVDEIDKAPRDFPNDLLNEIDRMYFRVVEAGYAPTPGAAPEPRAIAPHLRPIVVITSNSEKALPDPFLRRCVFHHIPFPKYPEEKDKIERIVDRRFRDVRFPGQLRQDALTLFWQLRGVEGGPSLRKPPTTAELLDWLRLLAELNRLGAVPSNKRLFLENIGALVKQGDDCDRVARFIESAWR